MNKSLMSVVHLQATYAVRAGILVDPGVCEKCGRSYSRLHKHHPDYHKPLDVVWLCPSCHTKEHPKPNPYEGKPVHKKYFWAMQGAITPTGPKETLYRCIKPLSGPGVAPGGAAGKKDDRAGGAGALPGGD